MGGDVVFLCNAGYIKIDRRLWQRKIMKAEFSFTFEHKENSKEPIYWKGKIYSKIKIPYNRETPESNFQL